MPSGASPRREREYDKLVEQFRKENRYAGREKEVASRIINRQRAEYGETRSEQAKDRMGTSPDRDLPLKDYQKLTIPQVCTQLPALTKNEIKKLRFYEEHHKKRKGLMQVFDRYLS